MSIRTSISGGGRAGDHEVFATRVAIAAKLVLIIRISYFRYKSKQDTHNTVSVKPTFQDREPKINFRVYRDNVSSRTSLNDTDSTTEPETPQKNPEEATVDTEEDKPTLLSISQRSNEFDSDNNSQNVFGEFTSASSEPAVVKPPPTAATVTKPVLPAGNPPTENNLFGDLAGLNLSAPAKPVSSNTSTNFDEFDVFKSAPASTTTQPPIDLNSLLQTSSNSNTNQSIPTPYTMPPANQGYYYPPGGVYIPTQHVGYPGYQPQYIPPMSNPYPAHNTRYAPPTQQQTNTTFLPPPMQPTKFPPNTFQSQNQSHASAKISNGNVSEKKSRDPFGDLNVFGQK